jgi:transcriptional regulator
LTNLYIPPHFREEEVQRLHTFMRRYSFATLISHEGRNALDAHDGHEGPDTLVSQLPLLLHADQGAHGTLVGHMARANPQWSHFERGREVVVMFHGPHAYVSPSWYATEVAVPTWNYATVIARGTARLVNDVDAAWAMLRELVDTYESGRPAPWSIDRLPQVVGDKMVQNIVGFEIEIATLEGKFKLSQNRSAADRQGVISVLRELGDPESAGVAALMEELASGVDA